MGTNQCLLDALVGTDEDSQPTENKKVKAVSWARVSTEMQAERGLSIPQQLEEIREYAKEHDIQILREYHEAASAFQKRSKRPEFHRMIEFARSKKDVSVILVHDMSRFSRDSAQSKNLTNELREQGIKIVSLNDPAVDPESAAGVYLEAIINAKNEAYSREIAFHTRKGCRSNVKMRDAETGWCYKNGGQPICGYKSLRLQRGEVKKGRPLIKSVWVLDNTVVNGRPMHEWVRHCLVELAAKGASLDELRDFCNNNELPPRRGPFWNTSTWNSMMQPHTLMKYCGYEIWNVHRKNGSKRPPSEWIIVPNAHPAIITEDQAKAIAQFRTDKGRKHTLYMPTRSRTSQYLLSGGVFKCGRCGANMTGLKTRNHIYYVCGSLPYRRGKGCGRGVYVPKKLAEEECLKGLQEVLMKCCDEEGFTKKVNEELFRIWKEKVGYDAQAKRKLQAVDAKIANIRRSIEDGLDDTKWANKRISQLTAQREGMANVVESTGEPPTLAVEEVMAYRRDLRRVLAKGTIKEQKQFIRSWVHEMTLDTKKLNIEVKYKVPEEMYMNCGLAGAGFVTNHVQPLFVFVCIRRLPTQGRKAVLLEAA